MYENVFEMHSKCIRKRYSRIAKIDEIDDSNPADVGSNGLVDECETARKTMCGEPICSRMQTELSESIKLDQRNNK